MTDHSIPRETLTELLDRVVFAAGWSGERAQRHSTDAQRLTLKRTLEGPLTDAEQWALGFEHGAMNGHGDKERTLDSVAESLAAILGVPVPEYGEASERNRARALAIIAAQNGAESE